ncbi:MAG TPA: cbb3-type cytochrome c oxidase subunit II [Chthoniobacteraceae bacterium]|nr:cbb3-type cytochrome c oxidase subunit II [Chthoniobacteraceae bacterium]
MRIGFLFGGIFATFVFAWFGQTLIPKAQLGGLQPHAEDDFSDIYPIKNVGVVDRGRRVYVAEGCYYCHTQLVRGDEDGSDIARGWGGGIKLGEGRRTVARDYIFDDPAVLGVARLGPDLTNTGNDKRVNPAWTDDASKGKLWHSADWLYAHLYNPRATAPNSIMPAYRDLFQTRKIASERSAEALDLTGDDAPPAGSEVVPTTDARDLVAYLLSLDRTHPVDEVKQGAPAK